MVQLDPLLMDYRRRLLAEGLAQSSITAALYNLKKLQEKYPQLLEVTPEQLEEILARTRQTYAAETRRHLRSVWRKFYGWAVLTGRIQDSPAAMLAPIKTPRVLGRIAPDDVVQMGLITASLPEKAMILLARFGGLRLSELSTLQTTQRSGDMLLITGKGGRMRYVPLNPELLDTLKRLELQVGDGYYFPGRWGSHMHPQSVNKIITRRLGVNPHSLRHAAATSAYRGTHDIRAVQEMLGHSSLQSTQIYIHVQADDIRAAGNATAFRTVDPMAGSAVERTEFESQVDA